jgi:hypothetical protein
MNVVPDQVRDDDQVGQTSSPGFVSGVVRSKVGEGPGLAGSVEA